MESEADEEPGQSHDQGDEIRTNNEQNDNKEEIDIEKYHGIISFSYIILKNHFYS